MFLKKIIKKTLKIILSFGFLILFLLVVFSIDTFFEAKKTVYAGQKLFQEIINNQPKNFEKNFESWQKRFLSFKKRIFKIDQLSGDFLDKKYKLRKFFDLVENITFSIPDIVGENGQKIYFVLLQNDKELRPSGGFMGSYAKLKFKDGGLEDVTFQDIYVPDGQIVGHVDPPWPIQEAFKQGWWRLRDANWDPDFPQAAKTIDWFFQKGKEEKADGIIAVNFSSVKKLLKILGPIYLLDLNLTVDEENLYQVAQSYSEVEFFPGSTQKKDVISTLGKAFLEKAKSLNQKEILPVIYQELEERQILISFFEPSLAKIFNKLDWDGSMKYLPLSTETLFNDYLYIVETNLGANKANCCLERKVDQKVDLTDGKFFKEHLKINFKNTGKYKEGIPPFFWGGTYVNFLRVYFPSFGSLEEIIIDHKKVGKEKMLFETRENKNLKGIGFFVKVPAQTETQVEVIYKIPSLTQLRNYHLIIQKQSGIESFPYSLTLKTNYTRNFSKIEKKIRKDEELFLVLYNEK